MARRVTNLPGGEPDRLEERAMETGTGAALMGDVSIERARAHRAVTLMTLAATLLAGCSANVPSTNPATTAPVTERVHSPQQLPVLDLENAVQSLIGALLDPIATSGPNSNRAALAIDPFIDQGTGTETQATRAIVARLEERVRRDYPGFELRTFTPAAVANRPLALIGSIAAEAEGSPPAGAIRPTVFRIQVVLADLRAGRIVNRATTRVRAGDVNTTPAPFFRDSPAWLPDVAAAAYLRTAEAGSGQPVDPLYLQALSVQALIAEGMVAYEEGRYDEAFDRYSEAERLPGGDQMRVYNGVYLASRALGRQQEAEAAFGRIVEFGLRQGKLSIRFLFSPGSTVPRPTIGSGDTNRMWLRQIAQQAAEHTACLELTGHTSPTGSAAANDRLSLVRAERLRTLLIAARPALRGRIRAIGLGARNPLIGTGADDASDVLDRRVEIEPVTCQALAEAKVGTIVPGRDP
jgi:outer membrane protein OmpA-like peptidoglycan-associated protein